MKYIDAEKLIAEIERRIEETKSMKPTFDPFWAGKTSAFRGALKIVKSLQQEQPEPSNNLVDVDAVREDFMTEVYRVLDADPTNDRANAIINAFDSLPTVSQEQPEVDLEKELNQWRHKHFKGKRDDDYNGEYLERKSQLDLARHFAEWGAAHLNARKEE